MPEWSGDDGKTARMVASRSPKVCVVTTLSSACLQQLHSEVASLSILDFPQYPPRLFSAHLDISIILEQLSKVSRMQIFI